MTHIMGLYIYKICNNSSLDIGANVLWKSPQHTQDYRMPSPAEENEPKRATEASKNNLKQNKFPSSSEKTALVDNTNSDTQIVCTKTKEQM